MNQKHLKYWEKKKARGKSKFILLDGGVFFGLILFGVIVPIIIFIISFIVNGFTFSYFIERFQFHLIFCFLISFPIGCLLGWLNWELSEWKYNQLIQHSK